MVDIVADLPVAEHANPAHGRSRPRAGAAAASTALSEHAVVGHAAEGADSVVTPERLHAQVAALRRYDARMKGLARVGTANAHAAGETEHAPRLSDWHWYREMMLPHALGKLPAALFEDPAVRLVFAEPASMMAGLVARALYARRAAVRRCIDRTVLAQLRVALGEGAVGRERLERLQRLTLADGEVPLPSTLTSTYLAHDGLARLRRDHPTMGAAVVHFVLMQLDGAPLPMPDDGDNAGADQRIGRLPRDAALAREAAAFFESLPYLIPELS